MAKRLTTIDQHTGYTKVTHLYRIEIKVSDLKNLKQLKRENLWPDSCKNNKRKTNVIYNSKLKQPNCRFITWDMLEYNEAGLNMFDGIQSTTHYLVQYHNKGIERM